MSHNSVYDGSLLPPPELRFCGPAFRDDATFVESADAEARRLVGLGATKESRILEIGCGPGRLPIGIIRVIGEVDSYVGIDISRRSIRWCTRHIQREHPSFAFHRVDAQHDRYNPDGPVMDESFTLPIPDDYFDVVYLHSVVANMIERDVRIYSHLFRKTMRPGALLFFTAFVEDDVPPSTINPDDYLIKPSGRLHFVRYERRHLISIFEDAGFTLERFDHGAELDGQSGIYLRAPEG